MYDLPGAYIRDFVELTGRWKVEAARGSDGLPVTVDALADPATRVPLQVCEAIVARGRGADEGARARRAPRHADARVVAWLPRVRGDDGEHRARGARAGEPVCSTRTSAVGIALHVEGELASVAIEERTPLPPALRETLVLALVIGVWQLGKS